jgi:5-methylthioadenosine/S-adenosylhomocysteine deaminase
LGKFLEVKSRTWSQRDAEAKSLMISDLLEFLSAPQEESQKGDYIKMVKAQQ